MSKNQSNTNLSPASSEGKSVLQGNSTQIPANTNVTSTYQGQAISDTEWVENNVPMVNDANVKRERNWSVENKK